MPNQSFLYNSTTGGATLATRTFIVEINSPALIRSAGLAAPVTIYQMVGDCPQCRPEDVLWSPVTQCGAPLAISPDSNQVIVAVPGRYMIGDPAAALTLVGDVNITKESLRGQDPSLLGNSTCPTPDVPCPSLPSGLQTSW